MKVLSVGQCAADHQAIRRLFEQHFGAEVIAAASAEEAKQCLSQQPFALVLVNRVLDRDGSSGTELLGDLAAQGGPPVMLVSNHADAQAEAVRRGAAPGFGKAALGSRETLSRLQALLQPKSV
ncbi:MAG: response regulator [Gemmataceae bacterium]|nr:response regulator [Gemmataceae bacterium]